MINWSEAKLMNEENWIETTKMRKIQEMKKFLKQGKKIAISDMQETI